MNKCVLCLAEHNNLWNNKASMYCQQCTPIRDAARGTISEIIPNLYLSDMVAASKFTGDRLCVHEHGPTYEGQCHLIPILTQRPNSSMDRTGAIVSWKALEQSAALIKEYVDNNTPLLVHCHGGVERSPLTIAWFLIKSRRCNTFQEAYTILKAKRPVVSERTMWLPKKNIDT